MEPQTIDIKTPPFYRAFSLKACFSVMLSMAALGIARMVLILWSCHVVACVIPLMLSLPPQGLIVASMILRLCFLMLLILNDNRSHLPSPHTNHACCFILCYNVMDLVIVY